MKTILEVTHPENQPSNTIHAYGAVNISVNDNIKIEFGNGELGRFHQIELTFEGEGRNEYIRINTTGSAGMIKDGRIRDFLDGESASQIKTSVAHLKCAPGLKGLKVAISRD